MARINNGATTMAVRDILNPKKIVVIPLAGDTGTFTIGANKTFLESITSKSSVNNTEKATHSKTKQCKKSKNNSNNIVRNLEHLGLANCVRVVVLMPTTFVIFVDNVAIYTVSSSRYRRLECHKYMQLYQHQ